MPFINLIEEQRIARKREQAKSRTALVVLTCVSGLSFVGCGFLFLISEALNHEISHMKNEAAKVKPIQDEIAGVREQVSLMAPKLASLESAQKLTTKWDTILNHLTVQTPSELWLTEIRCQATDPTKAIEVDFKGMGQRLQTIGEFILRLQGCEELEGVALKNTAEKLVSQSSGIEFDVVANVVGTVEEQPKKAAKPEEGGQ